MALPQPMYHFVSKGALFAMLCLFCSTKCFQSSTPWYHDTHFSYAVKYSENLVLSHVIRNLHGYADLGKDT